MPFDFNQDYFSLFGLPRQFRLDLQALELAFKAQQSIYHPDRVTTLLDSEKRHALQAATQINQALQTLKSPLARARYLLSLAGVDTQEETLTSMPAAFLMQQMEWRESVGDAKLAADMAALEHIANDLGAERNKLEQQLAIMLDDAPDYASAALNVRKLRFLQKLDQEIGDAIESLLD